MLDTKSKKIIFFGLGGAGQRHLRIISNIFKNKYKLFAYRKKTKLLFWIKNLSLISKKK